MHVNTLTASVAVLGMASAFPQYGSSYLRTRQGQEDNHEYRAPGPNDARSPCPATNTLANHGFIPRDGKNVSRQDFIDGFLNGWGMDESTIDVGIKNTFTICSYLLGHDCGETIPNITILDEPHTFEHDHSFSREDYHMAYADGAITNNANFNETIFKLSLDTLDGADHMDYEATQKLRLVRESQAMQSDFPSWFTENLPTSGFENGFIYAVMADFNLPDYATDPKVRVDWWKYWFYNESFPTPLGWHKPDPPKDAEYCSSVSHAIYVAPVTSTPSPLPTGAFNTDSPGPQLLPSQPTVPILPLPTDAPYVGPIGANGAAPAPSKRAAMPAASAHPDPSRAAKVASIKSSMGPQPTFKNPYTEEYSVDDFAQKQAYHINRAAQIDAAMRK